MVVYLNKCLFDEGIDARRAHLAALDLSGCRLNQADGPALDLEDIQIDHYMFLREGFQATGTGERGAVCLVGAHIGGFLEIDSALLRNDTGPALFADGLRVDRSVFLRNGFTAVGAGERGAVRLLGAHVEHLDCTGATMRNDTGTALYLGHLEVDLNLFLHRGFEAIGGGDGVAVSLADLHIKGALVFDPQRLEHLSTQRGRLDVDGLTYGEPPVGVTTEVWLRLLREGCRRYRPQPYQQLASALRAEGHDSEARRVLIEQRRDQLARGDLSRAERLWTRITGFMLGYGYQPWRALLALLGIVVVSTVLAVVLGGYGALVQAKAPAACPVIDRVGVGLDLGTPVITTGAGNRCQLTSSATGQTLTGLGWALRLLAWAFATLFVAGFTNAVRKS